MTFVDIIDAINEVLVARWPERTVYIDVCPVDFQRPSFWLHSAQVRQTVMTPFLVKHELSLELTLFDEIDGHYEMSALRLMADEASVLALLQQPLRVGDRSLLLAVGLAGREVDTAVLNLRCTYFDDNPAALSGGDAPPADTIALRAELDGPETADGLPKWTFRQEKEGEHGTS